MARYSRKSYSNESSDFIFVRPQHRPLRTFFLQIVVLAMHQNGRDTHIRQIKIYSPRETNIFGPSTIEPTTAQISAYFMIR